MTFYYVLEGKIAVPVPTFEIWLERRTVEQIRHVGRTEIGGSTVSTIFLGMNHQYGDGPPLLFETLVFEGPLDGEMTRYPTWDEAEAGHQAMVARVIAAQGGQSPQGETQ